MFDVTLLKLSEVEMPCSIGTQLKSQCSKENKYRNRQQISRREWMLLEKRSGVSEMNSVCDRHSKDFGARYASQQKFCCNLLSIHQQMRRTFLRPITEKFHDSYHANYAEVIEERKLCITCRRAITSDFKNIVSYSDEKPVQAVISVESFKNETSK